MVSSPSSVDISMVWTGCCKQEFDSTYPTYLNGIISQDEFRESINRINRIFTSHKLFIIFTIISAVILIGGIILLIFGTKSENNVNYRTLIGSGILIIILGSMAFCLQYCITDPLRKAQMRQALAEESIKYSSRSSRSCRWRLETTSEGEGHEVYDIVIDIDHFVPPDNATRIHYSTRVAPEPTVFFEQQDDSPPPPYSVQYAELCTRIHHSTRAAPEPTVISEQQDNSPPPPYSVQYVELCNRCSVSRQDLTPKFCSSCGQSFDRYDRY